jgi:TRAP-type C4-dicarboxylate transport system permease large subunit
MVLGLMLVRCDFLYRKVKFKKSLKIQISKPNFSQMKRKPNVFIKCATWTLLILVIVILGIFKFIVTSNHPMAITKTYIYLEPYRSYYRKTNHSTMTKDWNDLEMYKREKRRDGLGEHGGE